MAGSYVSLDVWEGRLHPANALSAREALCNSDQAVLAASGQSRSE